MKKYFVILLSVLIVGCGFTPMFSGDRTDIYVPPISGINGIDLRNSLTAAFGGVRTDDAEFILDIDLQTPYTKYKALETTGDASWQEVGLRANYTLMHDGVKIASGTADASESYTFETYLVASNASYNNAVQNIIGVLSDKISLRAIAEIQKYNQESKSDSLDK